MLKRSLCTALVLCVFCALFALATTAAPTHLDTAPEGYTAIGTAEDFVKLMHRADGFGWSDNYILMADISLAGREQAPIGAAGVNFSGIFDGNGYTVRGLSLSSEGTGDVNLALFGRLSGTVKNLTVCGEVHAAGNRVGGIVGILLGGRVENCVNRASVAGAANVGGIVGLAYSGDITVSGCRNEGEILGTLETFATATSIAGVGGIVGHIQNSSATVTVENCYNGGAVSGAEYIGGIVGYVYGKDTAGSAPARIFARCQNAGKVTATSTDRADVGGIAGLCAGVGGIYDCLNTGAVVIDAEGCDRPYAGGIVGRIYNYAGITNCCNAAAPTVTYTTETPTGVRAICGLAPANCTSENDFYIDGPGMQELSSGNLQVEVYTADKFARLNTNGCWTVPAAPELILFHTHTLAAHADGSTFCAACGETAAPAASDLLISVLPTAAEIGLSVGVDIRLSSTAPMWGAAFEIKAPDGFTLTGVTPKITATGDASLGASNTGFTLAAGETFGDPYRMAVLRTDGFSLVFSESVIATLTFAVDDALSPGEYAITLAPLEAYDAAGNPLSVTALGAAVAVDVHVHTLTPVAAVAPTCTTAGNNAYYYCAVCDTCFADAEGTVETTPDAETLPAGHTPAPLAAVAPTCTVNGLTAGVECSVCHTVLTAQEVVPATGHTPAELPAVPATYHSTGLAAGEKCSVCDAILVPQAVIPVLVLPQAVEMRIAAGEGVDLDALAQGDTFDVYITVPLSPGNTNQYYYRGYDLGSANKTFNSTNAKLEGETVTLGWTSTDIYVSNAEYVSPRSSYATATSLDLAGEIDDTPLYYVFPATTPALSIGAPTVTGEGDSAATELTISYGAAFNGYMINVNKVSPKPDAPLYGVIAKVTFTVASESGISETVTLHNSHTANGTPESYDAPSVGVTLKLAAHVHELTPIAAVAPTCTTAGNNLYYYCAGCETYFADAEGTVETTPEAQIIPAAGHTPVELPAVAATCTSTGLTAGSKCSVCNAILVAQEVVPANGHTPVEIPAVAPTCTESGLTAGSECSVCGVVLVAQEVVPATGEHDYVKGELTAPTMEKDAFYTYTCSVCGDSYEETVAPTGVSVTLTPQVQVGAEYKIVVGVPKVPTGTTAHWMVFTQNTYDPETPVIETVVTSSPETPRLFYSPGIPAPRMNDGLTARYYRITNGVKYVSNAAFDCNLVDYYNKKVKEGAEASLLEALEAMLNYGAAAQINFAYNTATDEEDEHSGLVNRHIPQESRKTLKADFEDIAATNSIVKAGDTAGKGLTYHSMQAQVKQRISLVLAYKRVDKSLDKSTLTFRGTYTDATGAPKTFEIPGADFTQTGGYFTVYVDSIAAQNLRCMITGAIYDAEDTQVSDTVTTSLECYVHGVLDGANENLKAVCLATLGYSDAVAAHVNQ